MNKNNIYEDLCKKDRDAMEFHDSLPASTDEEIKKKVEAYNVWQRCIEEREKFAKENA